MSWRDGAEDALASAIVSGLDHPVVLLRWVVLAEVMDEDGDRVICHNTGSDMRTVDTLGLLAYAQTIEQRAVWRAWDEDD